MSLLRKCSRSYPCYLRTFGTFL